MISRATIYSTCAEFSTSFPLWSAARHRKQSFLSLAHLSLPLLNGGLPKFKNFVLERAMAAKSLKLRWRVIIQVHVYYEPHVNRIMIKYYPVVFVMP